MTPFSTAPSLSERTVTNRRTFRGPRSRQNHGVRPNFAPVTSWLDRHRDTLASLLEPGETLLDADRVLPRRRTQSTRVPRAGFVLVVTDRRFVAVSATTWLARPRAVVTSWAYDDGATLTPAGLGRVRLVLPDRSIVTLRPYGPRSVTHLARR